jgi:hypothetical protein
VSREDVKLSRALGCDLQLEVAALVLGVVAVGWQRG